MKVELQNLRKDNKEMKDKVSFLSITLQLNEVTIMLYKKIEENTKLTKKAEHNQMQHTIFLTKLLLTQETNRHNGSADDQIQSLIKQHLESSTTGYSLA